MHFASEWGDPLDRFARLPFHAQSPLHPLLARDDPLVMFSDEEDFPKGDVVTGITFIFLRRLGKIHFSLGTSYMDGLRVRIRLPHGSPPLRSEWQFFTLISAPVRVRVRRSR